MPSIGFSLGEAIAHRSIARAQIDVSRSFERLSTGKRINRAADDPAGTIAVNELDAQIRSIERRITSAERSNTQLAARDGGLSVIGDLVTELNGLVVAAGNRDVLGEDELNGLQQEADSILDAINFLANTTTYQGVQTLTGYHASSLGGVTREITDENGDVTTESLSIASLGTGGALNLIDGDLELAQDAVEKAAGGLNSTRGAIGSLMNENDSTIRDLQTQLENLSAARSQIEDTDYYKEVSSLVRAQLLEQVSIRMALVARDQKHQVLKLLDGIRPVG